MSTVAEALDRVVAAKPNGRVRPSQQQMADVIARALVERTHVIVEAGTGTGKSLGYLIPSIESGRQVIVATATKTLQNQLGEVELPFLKEHLDPKLTWSIIKGRQSYACLAKLEERFGDGLGTTGLFAPDDLGELHADVAFIAQWARDHSTGDRDDLPRAVSDAAWNESSVSGMECPGANRCAQGDRCLAERSIRKAAEAQIIVTNHHLYGLDLTSGGRILPEHDAVVFDEAHKLEDALSSAFGVDITGGRLSHFAGQIRRILPDIVGRDGRNVIADVRDRAAELRTVLGRLGDGAIDPGEGELGAALAKAHLTVTMALRRVHEQMADEPAQGIWARVQAQGGHLAGDLAFAMAVPEGSVAWMELGVLRVAPVEIGPHLARNLLTQRPAILTSATLSVGGSLAPLGARLGFIESPMEDDPFADGIDEPIQRTYEGIRLESTFDYRAQALLYIGSELPDPRTAEFEAAALAEIAALVEHAGGRTLVLTTSHRMVDLAARRLAGGPFRVLSQGELPRTALLNEFSANETSVLVATMGYWEGIDIPGPSLSLVVIDKIPFPRPDDPLTQARRDRVEAAGGSAFNAVDLPRAAMLLAQGSGRLIRNEVDRGVVAILDNRLTAKRYGIRLIRSLPPMQRTSDRERAVRFLQSL